MARNVAVQILRGITANRPALGDGEFYFSTDEYQLYVGFNGDSLPVGGPMSVQLKDGTTANLATVQADGSLLLGPSAQGKSPVLKTGQLTTTATTANQQILTYTVTASKTLFLLYLDLQGRLTNPSATASVLGTLTVSLGGVAVYTGTFVNPTTSDAGSQAIRLLLGEGIPLSAATQIVIEVTPNANTSMLWTANLGGYEH